MSNEKTPAPRLEAARTCVNDCRALGQQRGPASIFVGAMLRTGLADAYTTIETPAGRAYVAWNDLGLSAVTRTDSDEAFEAWAHELTGRKLLRVEAAPPQLLRAMEAWLHGDRRARLTFDLRTVSPFMREALLKAREIPHGEVRPYSWIAREIGHPKAVRAVGTAMARNPIPLFIPCHRVVRADGRLGEYGMGGPEVKRRILDAEGMNVAEVEAMAEAGIRYLGSDTTHSFCYPSCHYAQRITPAHRVLFTSASQAHAAGYRPCNVCRPPETQLAS